MLARMSSLEIAEWKAFERAFGPIGNEWRDATQAAVLEQLQFLLSAWSSDFEPKPWPRPDGTVPDVDSDADVVYDGSETYVDPDDEDDEEGDAF